MKSIFISSIILNTSSYLCDGESLLQKLIRFCPVWAMLPQGCSRNSGGGSNFECWDYLYPCNGGLCRAYLYTGLSPIPRGSVPSGGSSALAAAGKCKQSHFQMVNWDLTLMPAGSHAAPANQLRAQEGPKHKHTHGYMCGFWGGGELASVTETVNNKSCDLFILKSRSSVVVCDPGCSRA